jgi:hypothetical protein
MKHILLGIAASGLMVVANGEEAHAQAVNANIGTTCSMDAANAAVPVGAWLLQVLSNPNPRTGATVNINDCNTNWSVTAEDFAGAGNMVATAGSTDHGGNGVAGSALTDAINVNGATVATPTQVALGAPTVDTDIPVDYAQNAQYADVAILPGSGSYQITLVYTVLFTP